MAKRIIDKNKAWNLINSLNQGARSQIHQLSQQNFKQVFNENAAKLAQGAKKTTRNFGIAAAGMTGVGIGVGIAERKGYLYPAPMPHESYLETLNKARSIKTDSNNSKNEITGNIIKEGLSSIFKNELDEMNKQTLSEAVIDSATEIRKEPVSKETLKDITKAVATWGASHLPVIDKATQPVVAAVNIVSEANPIKSSALQSIYETARRATHSILNSLSDELTDSDEESQD